MPQHELVWWCGAASLPHSTHVSGGPRQDTQREVQARSCILGRYQLAGKRQQQEGAHLYLSLSHPPSSSPRYPARCHACAPALCLRSPVRTKQNIGAPGWVHGSTLMNIVEGGMRDELACAAGTEVQWQHGVRASTLAATWGNRKCTRLGSKSGSYRD